MPMAMYKLSRNLKSVSQHIMECKMYRSTPLAGLMLAFFATSVFAQQTVLDETNVRILKRLDEILRKIEQIEERISAIEGKKRVGNLFWRDKKGILWNSSGDAVGFWGIDDQ